MKKTITMIIICAFVFCAYNNVSAQGISIATTYQGPSSINTLATMNVAQADSANLTFTAFYVSTNLPVTSTAAGTITLYGQNARTGTAGYPVTGLPTNTSIRIFVLADIWFNGQWISWCQADTYGTTTCLASNVNITATALSVCVGNTIGFTANGTGGTYAWTGSNLNMTTGSNVIATPTTAGTFTYTVVETNAGCASAPASVTINVNAPVTISATLSANNVCPGTQVIFTMNSGGSFTVSGSGTSTQIVTSPFPITASTNTTIYTIQGGSSGGCGSSTTTATLNVLQNTLVVQNSSVSLCNGGSVQLNATGATSYQWTPSTGLSNPNIGNPMASPSASIVYTVTSNSCNFVNHVTVNVGFVPVVHITANNTNPCSGSPVGLIATGANSYSWIGQNLNMTTGSNVIATPTTSGLYFVTGSNGACSDTASILIIVNQNSVLTVSSADTICNGSDAQLTVSGGSGLYMWTPGNYPGSSVTVTPNVTTVYTVTATNSTCISTATVKITVMQKQPVHLTANISSVCHASNHNVELKGFPANGTFSGNGTSLVANYPSYSSGVLHPSQAGGNGNKIIYYEVNDHGCISKDSTIVTILPSPVIAEFWYSTAGQFWFTGQFFPYCTVNIGNGNYVPSIQSSTAITLDNVPTNVNLVANQALTIVPNDTNACGVTIPIIFGLIGIDEILFDSRKVESMLFNKDLAIKLNPGKYTVSLYDAMGREVQKFPADENFTLKNEGLAPGTYILSVTNGQSTGTVRLIKQYN